MKKTISVYLTQGLAIASLVALSACTTSQPEVTPQAKSKPIVEALPTQMDGAELKHQIAAESLIAYSEDELEFQIAIALRERDWGRYIQFNNQLWQMSSLGGQAVIEQDMWDTLSSHSLADTEEMLANLGQHSAKSVQQWALLLSIVKGPATSLVQNLGVLADNQPDAIYTNNLLPGLISQLSDFTQVHQIAVLLPFEGKYQQVSKQIRNGILKAYFTSDQTIALKFYDTSDLENIANVYQNAKLDGAEFIIGPLRKEAVQALVEFEDPDILALNAIEEAPFHQFSYKSSDEIGQMVKLFAQKEYQNIGILTNDSRTDLKTAHALQKAWQEKDKHVGVMSVYPNHKPKLRNALGALINEDASKERYSIVRRYSKERFSFFPRTRKDFDAIVIIDNSQRIAVFQPQLAFFELKVPVYGSLQLSPKKLQNIRPNRDLRGVQFLTRPATLDPANLNSNFEAFGWDSFQAANHLDQLRLGGFLKSGKTGEITLKGKQLVQNLIWTKYNRKGIIERWTPPVQNPEAEAEAQIQAQALAQSEMDANGEIGVITVKNIQIDETKETEITPVKGYLNSLF